MKQHIHWLNERRQKCLIHLGPLNVWSCVLTCKLLLDGFVWFISIKLITPFSSLHRFKWITFSPSLFFFFNDFLFHELQFDAIYSEFLTFFWCEHTEYLKRFLECIKKVSKFISARKIVNKTLFLFNFCKHFLWVHV